MGNKVLRRPLLWLTEAWDCSQQVEPHHFSSALSV